MAPVLDVALCTAQRRILLLDHIGTVRRLQSLRVGNETYQSIFKWDLLSSTVDCSRSKRRKSQRTKKITIFKEKWLPVARNDLERRRGAWFYGVLNNRTRENLNLATGRYELPENEVQEIPAQV